MGSKNDYRGLWLQDYIGLLHYIIEWQDYKNTLDYSTKNKILYYTIMYGYRVIGIQKQIIIQNKDEFWLKFSSQSSKFELYANVELLVGRKSCDQCPLKKWRTVDQWPVRELCWPVTKGDGVVLTNGWPATMGYGVVLSSVEVTKWKCRVMKTSDDDEWRWM